MKRFNNNEINISDQYLFILSIIKAHIKYQIETLDPMLVDTYYIMSTRLTCKKFNEEIHQLQEDEINNRELPYISNYNIGENNDFLYYLKYYCNKNDVDKNDKMSLSNYRSLCINNLLRFFNNKHMCVLLNNSFLKELFTIEDDYCPSLFDKYCYNINLFLNHLLNNESNIHNSKYYKGFDHNPIIYDFIKLKNSIILMDNYKTKLDQYKEDYIKLHDNNNINYIQLYFNDINTFINNNNIKNIYSLCFHYNNFITQLKFINSSIYSILSPRYINEPKILTNIAIYEPFTELQKKDSYNNLYIIFDYLFKYNDIISIFKWLNNNKQSHLNELFVSYINDESKDIISLLYNSIDKFYENDFIIYYIYYNINLNNDNSTDGKKEIISIKTLYKWLNRLDKKLIIHVIKKFFDYLNHLDLKQVDCENLMNFFGELIHTFSFDKVDIDINIYIDLLICLIKNNQYKTVKNIINTHTYFSIILHEIGVYYDLIDLLLDYLYDLVILKYDPLNVFILFTFCDDFISLSSKKPGLLDDQSKFILSNNNKIIQEMNIIKFKSYIKYINNIKPIDNWSKFLNDTILPIINDKILLLITSINEEYDLLYFHYLIDIINLYDNSLLKLENHQKDKLIYLIKKYININTKDEYKEEKCKYCKKSIIICIYNILDICNQLQLGDISIGLDLSKIALNYFKIICKNLYNQIKDINEIKLLEKENNELLNCINRNEYIYEMDIYLDNNNDYIGITNYDNDNEEID